MFENLTEVERFLTYAQWCRTEADKSLLASTKAEWLGHAARYQKLAERLDKTND